MKAKKPINKTLIKPNQCEFNVSMNNMRVTNNPTNILNNANKGLWLDHLPPNVFPTATIKP